MDLIITLDPTNPIEKHVIDYCPAQDAVKSMFLVGFTVCQAHMDEIAELVDKAKHNQAFADVVHHYTQEVETLKQENLQLVELLHKASQQVDERHQLELESRDMRVVFLEKMLKDTEERMNTMYTSMYKDSVQQLRDMLKEKDIQLQLLKSTNAAKGVIGEQKIMDSLRCIYKDAHIEYTGKTAHSCDIRLTLLPTDRTFLFESKNKGYVDKADIIKFHTDIQTHKDSIVGAVFVSLSSPNIPGKGSLHIENSGESNIPVMYVGYDGENDFDLMFNHHVRMFEKMSHTMTQCSADASHNIVKHILEEAEFYYAMLRKNKKRLDDIKCKFAKYCQEAEDDGREVTKRLEFFISSMQPAIKDSITALKPCFVCPDCQKSYTTQRGLTGHKCRAQKT